MKDERPRREVALEALAVASIAIIPWIYGAFSSLVRAGAHKNGFTADHFLGEVVTATCESITIVFIMWRSGLSLEHFGIVRPAPRDLLFGLLTLFSEKIWAAIARPLIRLLPEMKAAAPAAAAHVAPVLARPSTAAWVLMPIGLLANAFAEEVGLRGYFIPAFEKLLGGSVLAVLASSLLFASYHVYMGPRGAVSAFVGGLVLGATFATTRRLWPCVIAHALWDIAIYAVR